MKLALPDSPQLRSPCRYLTAIRFLIGAGNQGIDLSDLPKRGPFQSSLSYARTERVRRSTRAVLHPTAAEHRDSIGLASAPEYDGVRHPPIGFRYSRVRPVEPRRGAYFTTQGREHGHTTDEHVVDKDWITSR